MFSVAGVSGLSIRDCPLIRFSLTFIHSKVNVSQYEITFSYFHDVVAPIIFPEQPENVRRV